MPDPCQSIGAVAAISSARMTSPGQLGRLLCGRAESTIRNKPDLIMTANGHSDKGDEWSPHGGVRHQGQSRKRYNENCLGHGKHDQFAVELRSADRREAAPAPGWPVCLAVTRRAGLPSDVSHKQR